MARNKRYSIIPPYPKRLYPDRPVMVKIPLNKYCKARNISRDQVRTLIRRRWVTASKWRGRIYVIEVCPEMIDQWYSIKS